MADIEAWNRAKRWRNLPVTRQRNAIQTLREDSGNLAKMGEHGHAETVAIAADALEFMAGLGGCNPEGRVP
jgi:hypothetical protein